MPMTEQQLATKRKWRKAHPEYELEYGQRPATKEKRRGYSRAYSERHPLRRLLIGARARAKRNGLEFTLTEESLGLSVGSWCPCCMNAFVRGHGRCAHPRSPTIDRIDNAKGYTIDNCEIICWRCNSLKKDATVDEPKKIIEYMEPYCVHP